MWRITKKIKKLKPILASLLAFAMVFSGFPSSLLLDKMDEMIKDANVVDLLYLSTKDGNVINKSLIELVRPGVEKANAASVFNIQTGYYIGNGNAKAITGLGFQPDAMLFKQNTNAGAGAMFQTRVHPKTTNSYFIATQDATGHTTLDENGFTAAGATSDPAAVGVSWVSFGGSDCTASGSFCMGQYIGNGAASRTISTGFDPDLVWVKRSTAVGGSWRSSDMPNNVGQYFHGAAQVADGSLFTTIGGDTNGFGIGGTSGGINNVNTGVYYFMAFKAGDQLKVGHYSGNGTSQSISDVGFQPDFVMAKNSATADIGYYTITEAHGSVSWPYTDLGVAVNAFTSLDTTGFSVGANSAVNGSGTNNIYYAAFGGASDTRNTSGNFTMANGSYTGTGTYQTISGLSFAPDLVIIKRNAASAGVFRTSDMPGDSTAWLDAGTANNANLITALRHDGFNVGTHAVVNTLNDTYYWTAYGNAWRAETNSGASDFFIGHYYGTAQNDRNITRLPFQPDLLTIKRSGATAGCFRTSGHGADATSLFTAGVDVTDRIQSFSSNSFQIGTTANVNTSTSYYWYFGFKSVSGGNFTVGKYDGNGTTKDITTNFSADNIWIKSSAAYQAVGRTSSMGTNSALPMIAATNVNNAITGITSTYFTVGTSGGGVNETNNGSSSYWWAAWNSTSSQGSSSPSYSIQTGYYIGNGNAKAITGLGFQPDAMLFKQNTNAGAGAMFQTRVHPKTTNSYFIATQDATGHTTLDENGFTAAGATSDPAAVGVSWVSFGGSDCTASGSFCMGQYIGNGAASRTISTGFDPDLVWVKRSTAVGGSWRSSDMPNNVGQYFHGAAQVADGSLFTTIGGDTNGFGIGGTSGGINNVNTGVYYFMAFKAGDQLKVGHYSGNGTSQSISDVGFQPDFVMAKNSATADIGYYTITEAHGSVSWPYTDLGVAVNAFTSLDTTGFSVGANSAVNGSGTNNIYYAAFGGASDTRNTSGNFTMANGSYTGTGTYQTISGLSFAPDLVIIKRNAASAGVFRTSDMPGDSTAWLDAGTANNANLITALRHDGFNVGTHAVVNTLNDTYYWTAYGNAWRAETNSGASDFFIGHYYGTAQNDRNITRLPFQPDLLTIKRSGATAGCFRTSGHGADATSLFTAGVDVTDRIQSFSSNSFQIGTTANVNTSTSYYWYFGFKSVSGGNFTVGKYDGNGTTKDITTNFSADNIWIKSSAAYQAVGRTSSMGTNSALPMIAATNVNNAITGITSTYFTVGTSGGGVNETNNGSSSYWWAAWHWSGKKGTIFEGAINFEGAFDFF